ncbi:MAG: MarR family transcriptional regulator [Pseudomonadota bacterium]
MDIYGLPGHLIRRMHQIHNSVFQTRVREAGYDLTSVQFAALAAIDAYPGRDQATIAGLIAHDKATIGGVLDRLQQKDLIQRGIREQDKRARVLTLSEAGHTALAKLQPVIQGIQTEILPGLTDEERRVFVMLSAKVAEAGNHLSRAPLDMGRVAINKIQGDASERR